MVSIISFVSHQTGLQVPEFNHRVENSVQIIKI